MKNATNAKKGVQKPTTSASPETNSPIGTSRANTSPPGTATWWRYQAVIEPARAAPLQLASCPARIDESAIQRALLTASKMKKTPMQMRRIASAVPCRSMAMINGSAVKVVVRVVQPVLPDRAEHIELEGVLDGLGLVLDPRRDVQHLALADGNLLAANVESERALQDVGHLLALVGVHRHEAAALHVDLRHHLPLAGDDLSRQHLGDFLEGDFVPPVQPNRLGAHERGAYTNEGE